jgi:hypothetical protein
LIWSSYWYFGNNTNYEAPHGHKNVDLQVETSTADRRTNALYSQCNIKFCELKIISDIYKLNQQVNFFLWQNSQALIGRSGDLVSQNGRWLLNSKEQVTEIQKSGLTAAIADAFHMNLLVLISVERGPLWLPNNINHTFQEIVAEIKNEPIIWRQSCCVLFNMISAMYSMWAARPLPMFMELLINRDS